MQRMIRRDARPIRRTTTVVLADESLQVRFDPQEQMMYGEVLSMAGFANTPTRRVPLVDVDRSTIKNVVGSVRNLRVDRGRLLGELSWARGQRAHETEAKYNDGHLSVIEVEVKPLELRLDLSGKKYDGEVRYVTRWSVVVAIIKPARE